MKVSAIVLALAATSAQAFTAQQPALKPMTALHAEFEDADEPTMTAIETPKKLFGVEVPSFITKAFDSLKKMEGPISIEDTESGFAIGETEAYLDDISNSDKLP